MLITTLIWGEGILRSFKETALETVLFLIRSAPHTAHVDAEGQGDANAPAAAAAADTAAAQ